MTPRDVSFRVAGIASRRGDDEEAHSMEDALYRDLLRAIAEGRCFDPAECARIALTTQQIDFCRWCA